jgi:hypothetical protein
LLSGQAGDLLRGGCDSAQEEDVVEGTLVHQVEAGFVAVEQGQLRRRGELAERGGDAGAVKTAGLGLHPGSHHLGFHGPGTAHSPPGGGHLLDHGLLDAIDGCEALHVLVEECVKALQGLAGEDYAVGQETVTDSVLGRAEFAFRGGRATGKTAVGLGRKLSS